MQLNFKETMIYKPNLIVKKLDIATKNASGRTKKRPLMDHCVAQNSNNLLTNLRKYTPCKNNELE